MPAIDPAQCQDRHQPDLQRCRSLAIKGSAPHRSIATVPRADTAPLDPLGRHRHAIGSHVCHGHPQPAMVAARNIALGGNRAA